ncbi:hypothetical protein Holit_02514 [Hollandina sp. SP2]
MHLFQLILKVPVIPYSRGIIADQGQILTARPIFTPHKAVSRIPAVGFFPVPFLPDLPGHHHFSPDPSGKGDTQFRDHPSHAPGIPGDLIPHKAVSPGNRPDEFSLFVLQFQTCPIQFVLNHKDFRRDFRGPIPEFLRIRGFVLASHGDEVPGFGKAVSGICAYPVQYRAVRVTLLEGIPEPVKFLVRNLRLAVIIRRLICTDLGF